MPSIRRGASAPPKKIFRNNTAIKRVMRGTVEVWRSIPPLVPYFYSTETSLPALGQGVWTTIHTHVVVGEGDAHVYAGWRFSSTPLFFAAHYRAVSVRRNGSELNYSDHGGSKVMAAAWESTLAAPGVYLNQGDVLTFLAYGDASNSALRTVTDHWFQVVNA